MSLSDLKHDFQIVCVGDRTLLQDLQKELRWRAKMKLELDRKLPFVRRDVVQGFFTFQQHYRLNEERVFNTAFTTNEWTRYFEALPELAIPPSLVKEATWLSTQAAADHAHTHTLPHVHSGQQRSSGGGAVRWAHTNSSSSGGGRRTQRQWRAGLPRAIATAAGHSVAGLTGWEWWWCSEHQ